MTQEDKELLLKDLCARLPYGVKCKYYDVYENCYEEGTVLGVERKEYIEIDGRCVNVEEVKPYLFPLSSMTDEIRGELVGIKVSVYESGIVESSPRLIDFYNKYHLDYRGLIPKGLAMDATGLNIYETI